MQRPRHPTLGLALFLSLAACGGKKGGGSTEPPVVPNEPPTIQAPSGLGGTAPSYSLVLPIASTQSLTFLGNDPEGALLHWQVGVDGTAATAAGLGFTTPTSGNTFVLDVQAVTVPAAVTLSLLVEDPRGGIAAIDLAIVRSGAPTITAITPTSAFATKLQPVVITGTAFQLGGTAATTAAFGGIAANAKTIVSDTTITATTPTTVPTGATVVAVANQFGSSSLPSSSFTMYAYPPSLFATDSRLDAGDASALEIARDGDHVHAVWLEGSALVHRVSNDRGATWSLPQTLSGIEAAAAAQVQVLGDEVDVVWVGDGTSCLLRRSIDGGATFEPVQRLDPVSPTLPVRQPRLARSGQRRYVAWASGDANLGEARLRTVASSDGGQNWTSQNTVFDSGANQSDLHLRGDGSDVWLVFEDSVLGTPGLYSARSTNAGDTWSLPERRNSPASSASDVQFVSSGGRLFACWVQGGALFLTTSADRGASWSSSTIQLQGAQSGAVGEPFLAGDADRALVAYVIGGTTVRVATFTLVGANVQSATVAAAASNSAAPELAFNGNYVFVAWREGNIGDGSARIQKSVSTDSGTTFATATGQGDGTAAQDAPRLTADGAHVLLGWIDQRDATPGVFVNRTNQ